jgi:hypothetical protein
MNNQEDIVSKLLAQDSDLLSTSFNKDKLEMNLKHSEAKERRGRLAMKWLWIVIASIAGVGLMTQILGPYSMRPIGSSLMLLAYAGSYLALLRTIMYVAFERPALDRAKADFRDSLLEELSQRLDSLSSRVESLLKSRSS